MPLFEQGTFSLKKLQTPVSNTVFFRSLSNESKIKLLGFLLLQCIILLVIVSKIAVHYDEWYSYRNFSSQKLSTIISFYFTSNNHVFYNVLSHFFVALPGPLQLLMRLTSLLATLCGTWYLFKLCKIYSTETATWLVVILYSSTYNVLLYAAQARGYGLLNFFTILSIYHAAQFNFTVNSKRKIYFVIVQALGLYTVPTFIYCIIPIYIFLIFNVPRTNFRKGILNLSSVGIAAATLTLLLYLPILLSENAAVLLHTNTSEGKFSLYDEGAFESIIYFLRKMYFEVLGISYPLISLLIISILLLWRRKLNRAAFQLYALCLTLLVSPILIILLHNYFAYGRNWIFLCVPTTILVLLIAEPLLLLARSALVNNVVQKILKQVLFSGLLLFYGLASFNFLQKHKREYAIDYKMAEIAQALPNIKSIAITEGGFAFYAADVIQGGLEGRMEGERVEITNLSATPKQDLLILQVDRVAQNSKNLRNYKLRYITNDLVFFTKKN